MHIRDFLYRVQSSLHFLPGNTSNWPIEGDLNSNLCAFFFFFPFWVMCIFRWERYQSEEEAVLGRGKRQRKAVSYREAYASHPNETLSEVTFIYSAKEVYAYLKANR